MLRDRLLILLIHLLRAWTLNVPWERGKWRIAELIRRCARGLSGEHHILVRSSDGRRFRIDPRDRQYQLGLLDAGGFETKETALLASCLAAGDIVVDAGANFGWYTTAFSRVVGDTGQVHAFEPMPNTATVLEESCRLNACGNVIVNRCALGERTESCVIYHRPGLASGDATLYPVDDAVPYQCEIIPLDHYFSAKELARCNLIKCDVEGAELSFVRGAAGVLKAHRPLVMIELNRVSLDRARVTSRQVVEEIERCGDYRFLRIDTATGRLTPIKPADCDELRGYTNVLCIPDGSPVLARLALSS